ncbi:unnamed protein product [Ceratitis capitata]|uniref:(Mediterranean fruit fly) hypothetical protein n=1 Tax=Ceratitis capitata TaxID=7213 RepID=A0A811U0S8_CERCA|nr:unnamed protein product [Ceratitis capitata]
MVPDIQVPPKKLKSRPPPLRPTTAKNNNGRRSTQIKNGKRISLPTDSEPSVETKNCKPKCPCDPKQTKNKQNFQYQDMKNRMEAISEEAEQVSDDEEPFSSKNIQNSCADFLNIVHDTVLETVQSSVECMMRNYFVHTMEKVETLCSQMMRNECLLSKMYLDILDTETQKEANEERAQTTRCNCHSCACTEENFISFAKEKILPKGRRLSGSGNTSNNFNGNVIGAKNLRDSDNEIKTDPSLMSCTNSSQVKFKLLERSQSTTNSTGNEEVRRNITRVKDSGHLENPNGRRMQEMPNGDDTPKPHSVKFKKKAANFSTITQGPVVRKWHRCRYNVSGSVLYRY